MNPSTLAASIDHTNLALGAQTSDLVKLCLEAKENKFATVMVYPYNTPFVFAQLLTSPVGIGAVVGFPSGRGFVEAKVAEVKALKGLATDIDMVLNYQALKSGCICTVVSELIALREITKEQNQLLKVIVETCYLTTEEKLLALRLCEEVGADFIKTSTGFGSEGATLSDIELWANNRKTLIQLKASGGIKTLDTAVRFLNAGATRLGTSSGVTILKEALTGEKTSDSAKY
jgi:deoxyribose-phosphate aldolase